MPIPPPLLDDKRFDELVDEMLKRIPVYAPEWTDHNQSDPGVTLVELFAWIAEDLRYRLALTAPEGLRRFLARVARIGTPASRSVLRQLRGIRIEEWSAAKEAQVLAHVISRICQLRCCASRMRCRGLRELEQDVAVLLLLRQRLSDGCAAIERQAGSRTPGATWKHLVLTFHWLFFTTHLEDANSRSRRRTRLNE